MHPKQHPKQLSKPNRISPLLVILLAAGLTLQSRAQDLPAANWNCGPYSSQDQNPPDGSGSTISYSSGQTSTSGAAWPPTTRALTWSSPPRDTPSRPTAT